MLLNRKDVINKAYHECLKEMYAKAQPSMDYDVLLEQVKLGEINDDPHDPVYNRYYLSSEEFYYILKKYINSYRLNEQFTSDVEIVEDYFSGKGNKDVWVSKTVDEDGFEHPGYRSYESVPHINDAIKNILNEYIDNSDSVNYISNDISNLIFEYLSNCKEYYRFDTEEQSFSASVALGCSPTSNKDIVIRYWKEKGIDLEIEDRNPLLFYDMDECGESFEECMEYDYGDNWKEIWWKKYYETNDGKTTLVKEYFKNNNIKNLHISSRDNDLYITTFKDNDEDVQIDEYMKINHIKYETRD